MVYFHKRGPRTSKLNWDFFFWLLNPPFFTTISLPLTPLQAPVSDDLEFHPFRVLSSTALSISATNAAYLLATVRLPKCASFKPVCGFANGVQSDVLPYISLASLAGPGGWVRSSGQIDERNCTGSGSPLSAAAEGQALLPLL